ncbi:MAG: phosphoribosyltransferase domain-containing protein [Acidobacteria bacterium]|nr:phosphoribosyltransferase domain-containing protein [Acidobacteriota bacterium]
MTIQVYHLERLNNPSRKNAFSFHFLAKLGTVSSSDLEDCRLVLRHFIEHSLNEHPLVGKPLIVGLAESGILLSALLHQEAHQLGIAGGWICSTRRPASGIRFIERHSHQPAHILPVPANPVDELWLIEDEITTGQTIFQVIRHLSSLTSVKMVRIFTLVDARSDEQRTVFSELLEQDGIRHSVHSLLEFHGFPTMECFDRKFVEESTLAPSFQSEDAIHHWMLPETRPALSVQTAATLDAFDGIEGSLLVIGEAMDMAVRTMIRNPQLSIRHVTLSPWKIDHQNVFDRIHINGKYYVYNLDEFQGPVHILSDPFDHESALSLQETMSHHGYRAEVL